MSCQVGLFPEIYKSGFVTSFRLKRVKRVWVGSPVLSRYIGQLLVKAGFTHLSRHLSLKNIQHGKHTLFYFIEKYESQFISLHKSFAFAHLSVGSLQSAKAMTFSPNSVKSAFEL